MIHIKYIDIKYIDEWKRYRLSMGRTQLTVLFLDDLYLNCCWTPRCQVPVLYLEKLSKEY